MMTATVICADVLTYLPTLEAESFDAVLCDPPYGLEFMHAWDAPWKYGFSQMGIEGHRKPLPSHGSSRNPVCQQCHKHQRGNKRCVCAVPTFDETPATTSHLFQDWCTEWARELSRVLKPGAHVLAFGSTRTHHRLMAALEDAGFELRDCLGWCHGMGFPKSLAIDKAIDAQEDYQFKAVVRRAALSAVQAAGLILPGNSHHDWTIGEHAPSDKWWTEFLRWLPSLDDTKREHIQRDIVGTVQKTSGWFTQSDWYNITAPATDAAKTFHGYGSAFKPALEFVIVARKPLQGTLAQNAVRYGTGALHIDAGRLGTGASTERRSGVNGLVYGRDERGGMIRGSTSGRWPPNLVLSHLPPRLCLCPTLTPDAAPLAGCRQCGGTGEVPGCTRVGTRIIEGTHIPGPGANGAQAGYGGGFGKGHGIQHYADPDHTETIPAYRCQRGVDGAIICPVELLDIQVGKRSSGGGQKDTQRFPGYGGGFKPIDRTWEASTGNASRFFLTPDWAYEVAERLAGASPLYYTGKASRSQREAGLDALSSQSFGMSNGAQIHGEGYDKGQDIGLNRVRQVKNVHPTVKNISLTRWLAALILPPAAYAPRHLLCPFAGVGSEMIGAILAGWDDVIGIEQDESYCTIARQRLAWWCAQPNPDRLVALMDEDASDQPPRPATQLGLW